MELFILFMQLLPEECLELRYTAHTSNPGYLGRAKVASVWPCSSTLCCAKNGNPLPQALSWSTEVAAWMAAGLQPAVPLQTQLEVAVAVGAWARLGFLDTLSPQDAEPLVEAVYSRLLSCTTGKPATLSLQQRCSLRACPCRHDWTPGAERGTGRRACPSRPRSPSVPVCPGPTRSSTAGKQLWQHMGCHCAVQGPDFQTCRRQR